MTIWSSLRPLLQKSITKNVTTAVALREMSGHGPRLFPMQPSRFQWRKFKDLVHFYIMLGAIPVTGIILYANIFVGPATLTEIPEDYTPKHWEYHRHPITRFMAKHIFHNPQQEYEKYMHFIYEEEEKRKIRKLERVVRDKMEERHDFQAYYFKPVMGKYYRKSREYSEELVAEQGD